MKTNKATKVEFPESSNIAAIEHVGGNLLVTFKNQDRYVYEKVPYEVFTVICESDSVGSSFHKLIRNGGYSYSKISKDAHIATEKM